MRCFESECIPPEQAHSITMNTYSIHGPWPENPDLDYLSAELIEAFALESRNFERDCFNSQPRTHDARRDDFRDHSALNSRKKSVVVPCPRTVPRCSGLRD